MYKIRAGILCFFALLTFNLYSQDIEFSQPYMNPLYINPANTGLFNGNVRGIAVYRNQWTSMLGSGNGYVTRTGSADFSFNSGETNHVGAGLMVYKDGAGVTDLNTTDIALSGSYNFALRREKDYYLCLGFQVGLIQRSVNINKMTFGSQYVNGFYDPTNASYESPVGSYRNYSDVSVGGVWFHYKSPRENQYIGVAISHINRPNLAFILNDIDYLYRKYAFSGGLEKKLNAKIDFMPQIIASFQGPYFQFYGGCLFKFVAYRPQNKLGGDGFSIGPYYRIVREYGGIGSDAIVVATRYDISNLTLGLSYDINVSTAATLGTRALGGPEVSFMYLIGIPKQKKSRGLYYYCPKF